jgi:hypothetical protein
VASTAVAYEIPLSFQIAFEARTLANGFINYNLGDWTHEPGGRDVMLQVSLCLIR